MRWLGTAFRAHDPRWSFAPISGEGAACAGGRFNPAGVPALYLALTVEGMLAEVSHGLGHRLDPLTICSYDVDVADLVDLRTEADRAAAGTTLAAMACPWALDRAEGRIPASWHLAEATIGQGAAGLVVPSFATGARVGMANLVLWRWGPDRPHRVTVIDPEGRLPRRQAE